METEFAPAKVNLFLHVTGQRADGYHLLESLAVFADLGDRIEAEAAPGLSLAIDGPFGSGLATDDDNLVLRAARMLSEQTGSRGAALRLQKNLPIASGIGGGSSDAAATLKALSRLWNVAIPAGLAISLGADVPVCLAATPQLMRGVGEALTPVTSLPRAGILLVNPMRSVSTAAVFRGLASKENPPAPPLPKLADFADLTGWLAATRNDLQPPALADCPQIAEVLDALSPAPFARMSGSGATCFALFPDRAEAERHAETIRKARPTWWVAAGMTG